MPLSWAKKTPKEAGGGRLTPGQPEGCARDTKGRDTPHTGTRGLVLRAEWGGVSQPQEARQAAFVDISPFLPT